MTGIYAIHNIINGKYYIGQARDIDYRWMQHRSRLKCGTHENKHLQASYNKYGKNAFEYFIVKECSKELLDEMEVLFIEQYDSYNNGYNQDKGGAGCKGYKHTEEEILKMRMIQNPRAVLQLDKDLNIVAEWVGCSHAAKTLKMSRRQIQACCDRVNRQKTVRGYYFIYKDEYENNTVDWNYYLNINQSMPKKVNQYDLNMNLIKTWDSIYSIQKECGYHGSEISSVCNYKKKTYKQFVWRFRDEYTKEQYDIDCSTDFINRKGGNAKTVLRYDLDDNLIAIYKSLSDAVRQTGFSRSSIQQCLYGKTNKSHDSVWKYDN